VPVELLVFILGHRPADVFIRHVALQP